MTDTVIAVFDTYEHAESAKRALANAGFGTHETQLHPEQDTHESRNATLASSSGHSAGSDTGAGGSIRRFFSELFGDEQSTSDADHYAEAVRRGSFVLVIDAETEAKRDQAVALIERFHPIDIEGRAKSWQASGWTGHDRTAPALTDEQVTLERQRTTGAQVEGSQVIPVIQEELQVGKQQVSRGGVRVYQRISEKPVQETVSLLEEHINVERRPVDRPATAASLGNMKEESFELREMAEQAVVAKTARVVEEVVIGKETTQREQTVSDTVRRTDVSIEKLPGESGAAGASNDVGKKL